MHRALRTRRHPWAPSRWLCGVLTGFALWSAPPPTVDALGSPTVEFPERITFQDGKLTARIATMLLRQVMEEISRLSGIQVRWMDAEVREQAVSVEFTALPLSEAVRRMLKETNFLLVYAPRDEGTQLTQVWIASREEGGAQRVLNRQPAPPVEPPPTGEEQAEAVTQPLDALIQTAMGDADLAARLSAIEDLASAARQDPKVRELLADLASNDSHPQVRDAASTMLGGRP